MELTILLGPTGVGKTALSLALARAWGCPILSCDSRQLYKEMHIGTAALSVEEMQGVTHYFMGSHSILEPYSAGAYELEAWALVEKLAPQYPRLLMVGGSCMYIDAFCKGMDNFPPHDPQLRAELNRRLAAPDGLTDLRRQLQRLDPETYRRIDPANGLRILRAVEVSLQTGRPYSSFRSGQAKERPCVIHKRGLTRPREELYARIDRRVDQMMAQGLEEEARRLWPHKALPALNTVGYRELFGYFEGQYPLEEAVRLIKRNSRHYAKKQLSYWGRDPEIRWETLS